MAGERRAEATQSAPLDPVVAAAFAHLGGMAEAVSELQIELSEIPAPTGAESERAGVMARWLQSTGCRVEIDGVGNVVGRRTGREPGPAVALSAHLDTVFPAEQAVAVARPGDESPYQPGLRVPPGQLHGPGIADDAAGLAALIAIAQALAVSGLRTEHDVLFVATVGEEGRGNLRGARHFFSQHGLSELSAFITIDHPEPAVIVHRGVGSLRYSVEFRGAGGHAWGHFGRYNPAVALGAAVAEIGRIETNEGPRATFNVGLVEAGRSVNSIPESARMEIDLRSEDSDQLARLDALVRKAVAKGHREEEERRQASGASVAITEIGKRPAGETPLDSALVQSAQRALKAEGFVARMTTSSTDANAAMAAGIPAICLSWGGRSDNQHSVSEFFAAEGREKSLAVVLLVLLDLAGTA